MAKRYQELDSLRGLAASSVVLHHSLLSIPIFWAAHRHQQEADKDIFTKTFSDSPLHMFWAGHEAVLLFFVLSGFVLTLLLNSKRESYLSYLVGRFCRIYLPYIFSIGLSIGLMNFFIANNHPNLSVWFNGMWEHIVSPKEIVSFFFNVGN